MPRGNVRVSITADASGVARETKAAERHLTRFGKSASTSMKTLGGASDSLGGKFSKLAKAASLVGAGYLAIAEGKEAVNVTTDLAKATIGLNKNLGLSVQVASEWAAVAKVRGVETKALNMSFGTLAKQTLAAKQGTDASVQAFKAMGVTQAELKRLNFQQVLAQTSDGLKAMGPGADRTALSMKLFGRGWQTIVPLLRDGSRAMEEQLALARKYGATFSGGTIKSMKDFIAAQREAKFATLGLQVAFGTALAPALAKIIPKVAKFVNEMRLGKGEGGKWAQTIRQIARVIEAAVPPTVAFLRVMGNLAPVIKLVRFTTIGLMQIVVKFWINTVPKIAGIVKSMGSAVTSVFKSIRSVAVSVTNAVAGKVVPAFNALKDVVNVALTPLRKVYGILKDIAGIAGKVVGVLGDVGGVVGKIPGVGDPKGWREKMQALVQSNLGQMPGGTFHGGTWKWANQIAGRFGLHTSSSWRSVEHNAAVGGVPGSLHTHGSMANPGAIDMVGPVGQMNQAAAWARSHIPGIQEVLVHDAGSGLHLHLGFFAKGGKARQGGQMAVVGEEGPELVSLPEGSEVFSHSRSRQMVSQAAGMGVPGFAAGGSVTDIFASEVRRSGLKGRMARTVYGAMLRANDVEAGAIGANPSHGDADSLGVFQIRGMHGSAAQRMDPAWSAQWFINTAKSVYRPGMSGAALAAAVERPASQYRFKYGDSAYVNEGQVASLVSAFAGGGRGGTQEDSAAWNWATMGNKKRGVFVHGRKGKLVVDAQRFARLRRQHKIDWKRTKHIRGDKTAAKRFKKPNKPPRFFGLGRGGVLGAFMGEAAGKLNMKTALAALTAGDEDDIAAAQEAIGVWSNWLDIAKRNKDVGATTEAATNLKSAQDTLTDLTASDTSAADALAANTAAIEAHNQLLAEMKGIEQTKLALVQTQGPALLLALAGISNGWIGGNAGLGRSFPSFAGLGGLART